MSIQAIGGAGSVLAHRAPAPSAKPESKEAAGTVDHDGDAEDAARAAKAAAPARQGRVDVKA